MGSGAQKFWYKGKSLTVRDWAETRGIKKQTVITRLSRGWTIAEALGDVERPRSITLDGYTQTVREWSDDLGIPKRTINDRLAGGARPREALDTDYDRRS